MSNETQNGGDGADAVKGNRKEAREPVKRRAASRLAVDRQAIKTMGPVAVAYSDVEREQFATEEAYQAEVEVVKRAEEVVESLEKLKISAKAYPADRYFLAKLLVDKPALVLNLVDTLRGSDALQVSIPGALELANIPYTGAGMRGLVIGNDRNLVKQLLDANDIPTPPFQFISRKGQRIQEDLGLPLIVKLNESGGSVGIDNAAVKETFAEAQEQADELLRTYKMPVIVERFVDGPELTVVVIDDGTQLRVFCAEKVFNVAPDGKHNFTSLESYKVPNPYYYKKANRKLVDEVTRLACSAFTVLHFRDYAKFDVRVDESDGTPYFTDANPNTAFGPDPGLPFTEVLSLHKIKFSTSLASMMSKHARRLAESATPAAP